MDGFEQCEGNSGHSRPGNTNGFIDDTAHHSLLNHCRMMQLCNKTGARLLVNLFRGRWLRYMEHANLGGANKEWTDGTACGGLLFKLCQSNRSVLPNKMVEKRVLDGNTKIWDVTVAAAASLIVSERIQELSRSCSNPARSVNNVTSKNVKGGGTLKPDNYAEQDAYIITIRTIRNEIAHCAEIANDKFSELWSRLEAALVGLGADMAELQRLKTMELSKSNNIEGLASSEAEKLKLEANKAFKDKKFLESIEIYSAILKLPGLSSEYQAVIYSNRSASYLLSDVGDAQIKATQDAKVAVQLRPSWWRAYYRLGRAYSKRNKCEKALVQMNMAFLLNPADNDVKQELYALRQQINRESRNEHARPQPHLKTDAEISEGISEQMGISLEKVQKFRKFCENLPYTADVIRGHRFRDGRGVEQNYEKSIQYYAKAAKNGNTEGMYNYALLLEQGLGTKRDYSASLYWLKKAATTERSFWNARRGMRDAIVGIPESQHALGLRYAEGVGVEQNYKEAAKWYQIAVENSFAPSANNLGLFYQNGTGVERSLTKAFECFQLASKLGETPAMMNLADCYFRALGTGSAVPTEEDFEKGTEWIRRAAQLGDMMAVAELEKLEKWPSENKAFKKLNSLFSCQMPQCTRESRSLNSLDYQQHVPKVREAAINGSTTARDVLTIWQCTKVATEAFKQGNCSELVSHLAKAIRLVGNDMELVTIPELYHTVLKERMKSHPNDVDAIVCHVCMSTKSSHLPEFLDTCLQKFPSDLYFLEMRAACHIYDGETQESLKLLERALNLHPNNVRILYVRATAYAMTKQQNTAETIKAFTAFLDAAPADHQKVPAALYRKAMCYLAEKNNYGKFATCFEDGLAAEKRQLPCFLPYDFPPKYLFEKMYNRLKQSKSGISTAKRSSLSNGRSLIFADPRRKMLLTRIRDVSQRQELKVGMGFLTSWRSAQPRLSPQPPRFDSLKKITLGEIDPNKDKVYDGFLLEARVIDWPIFMKSIFMVVEDENRNVERLAIYNWPNSDDKAELMKTFQPNRKLTIINPYLRRAQDMQSLLRVDSPTDYLILGGLPKPDSCHCCGLEVKTLLCGKCKMSRYCSKECQTHDWSEFEHKLVCKYLAKYAADLQTKGVRMARFLFLKNILTLLPATT